MGPLVGPSLFPIYTSDKKQRNELRLGFGSSVAGDMPPPAGFATSLTWGRSLIYLSRHLLKAFPAIDDCVAAIPAYASTAPRPPLFHGGGLAAEGVR